MSEAQGRPVVPGQWWELEGPPQALRLAPRQERDRGREFTWSHLLFGDLGAIEVFVLYFPSRFNLDVDRACERLLDAFGRNTGPSTSVCFWDPRDDHFDYALKLFGLERSPAVVLVSGRALEGVDALDPDDAELYDIKLDDKEVLADEARLAAAVARAHQVMRTGAPEDVARYVRSRDRAALLTLVGRVLGKARDELVRCKPRIGLPGGASVGLG